MRGVLWMAALVLPACDDTVFPSSEAGGGPTIGDAEGWCAVRVLFAGTCVSCHSASGALGGLDLASDPHTAVVGVTSAAYGVPLVVAGDPDGSLLVRKLEGSQGPDEGGSMPPGGSVDPAVIALVRAWIADGASDVCDGTTELPPADGYHPEGWEDPGVHGIAMKLHQGPDADCRTCHGPDLEGDVGPACSSCHPPAWETTCTFCHGDPDRPVDGADRFDSRPAPPEDIDDDTDPASLSFPAHLDHLTGSDLHADWDCTECHVKPTSALDAAHVFDDPTPAVADVVFSPRSLSSEGRYEAQTCTNLYCHGDGQGPNGTVTPSSGPMSCDSCHSGPNSNGGSMSGRHEDHLDEGIDCAECHNATVSSGGDIIGPRLHVDGDVTVDFGGANMTITNLQCTGSCHGEGHNSRSWFGDDD